MKIASSLFLLASAAAGSASAFVVAPSTPNQRSAVVLSKSAATAEAEAAATSSSMGGAALSGLTADVNTVFTSEDIDRILPHRYPLALVDKVVEYEAGVRAVGVKSVTKVSR